MTHRPIARVFFARGYPEWWSTSGLVRLATRSELAHVSIGDGWNVLEPTQRGDRFVSEEKYVTLCPSLTAAVEIKTPAPIRLETFPASDSRGRLAFACVRVVKAVLGRAGVPVPWHIVSPAGLFRHLVTEGADLVRFPRT